MGTCTSKPSKSNPYAPRNDIINTPYQTPTTDNHHHHQSVKKSPFSSFYSPNPLHSSTPRRSYKRPFPPPSPAKHIKAVLALRQRSSKPKKQEGENQNDDISSLDKSFGFSKQFSTRYEIGEEIGRGHFGYTCSAIVKKGDLKGQEVAVKIIPKAKMTTAIAIEDVRREVKILRSLTGHKNLVQFYDAFEDYNNVYIVMELCKGGELLDKILARGGKYSEDEAKAVMVQILNFVAFCHLQGVAHRDLKPENFLYTSKYDNSQLKAIDFGLSDFVKPDERLNDIVGSACYVAPEVLQRSYGTEADVWSVGVIAYILLSGRRPFWARTESGIFQAVLKAIPTFDESPWPTLSPEAKDFVKLTLNKDPRKRMSAAQALSHPWIRNYRHVKVISLDILVFRLLKAYMQSSSLRKSALRALSKTLTSDELFHLKEQFALLDPKDGCITLDNIKVALMKNATDAMKDSRITDLLSTLNALQYSRMNFDEFCAAGISVYQLETLDLWDQHARCAYDVFENDGNKAIVFEELASELGLGPSVPVHAVLNDWIRNTDGKLSFIGFVKLLHGVSGRTFAKVL